MTDEDLVTVCAWCITAGTISAPEGVSVSHGICPRHKYDFLLKIPLQSVIARLQSTEYLDDGARRVIATELARIVQRLERLGALDPGERR